MPKKGEKMSQEHRDKIAAAHRGKKQPWSTGKLNPAKRPEVQAKMSASMKGKPHLKARGEKHWNFKDRDPEEKKHCECGCGVVINRWILRHDGKIARERKYVLGHQSKGKPRPDFQKYLEENVKQKDTRNHPKGSDHHNWKGGVAGESHKDRQSKEYKVWRDQVYKRDNFTCQICFKKLKRDIVAHHYLSWSKYPEYRFLLWNGVCLCRKDHKAYFHPEVGQDTRFE